MPSTTDPYFELDGDIDDDPGGGDDWKNIVNAIDSTGILSDNPEETIFTTGGSKDIQYVKDWKHKPSSHILDKDDIVHAAAAAYDIFTDKHELVIYLHGDRFSNDGDAQMGVWFFQQRITPLDDGTFEGEHQPGDLLMQASFINGGENAVVRLYEWDPNAKKNLKLLAEGVGGAGTDNFYFATSNVGPTEAWSDYTPKSPAEGYGPNDHIYPENSFFEGGINLSWAFRDVEAMPCFSTFVMESRSSHGYDSTLKDFVVGNLDTCKLKVTKSCDASELNRDNYETLDHNYSYSVENIGFGDITEVWVHDDKGTSDPSDDIDKSIGGLAKGDEYSEEYQVVGSTQNPPTNTLTATGYMGPEQQYAMAPVSIDARCKPVKLSPTMNITKECHQELEAHGGYTVVKVVYQGQVCNTSDANDANATKLVNVSVTDVTDIPETGEETITITYADMNDQALYPINDPSGRAHCLDYEGFYYPTAPISSNACDNKLNDTVTATAEYTIGEDTNVTTTSNTASCYLCVDCPPPVTP